MKNILVLGAGRSASSLISYLLGQSAQESWQVTVGDYALAMAEDKVKGHPHGRAIPFDINDETQRLAAVREADIVISMLPARFHIHVAKVCLGLGVPLVTASYVSPEMKALDSLAKEKGVILLNECGLDPGIDHMSAMKVIDQIRAEGHELVGFETFTGGLLAPTEEENPWEYKFTWNPRNVVLAGQGIVKFIQEGTFKFIPYHRLFRRTELVHIPGHGYFEGYANRDSLKYLDVYGLEGIRTLFRGTFRRPGFCKSWDVFVQLGATDDSYLLEGVGQMTHRQFINSFLSYNPKDSVELKLAHYLQLDIDGPEMYRLKWLGLFEDEPVGLEKGTPAQVLEHILKKKWSLSPEDRDMVVMWHKFDFLDAGKARQIQSTMVAIGDNEIDTAMSKTVGLPVGIAAKMILKGEIQLSGVHIPNQKAIYGPILDALSGMGIELNEKETSLATH